MIFEHRDGLPIGSRMPLYQNILDDIKKATAHLKPPEPTSSALESVDLEHYELCLNLGEPYFILFPKDPDTHKVLSSMSARRMAPFSKSLLHPWLEKLSRTFTCFLLEYRSGYDGYDMKYEDDSDGYNREYESYNDSHYSDDNWDPDFTACSSDDCGMCGNCDY